MWECCKLFKKLYNLILTELTKFRFGKTGTQQVLALTGRLYPINVYI
jgi:hypothetical protein